MEEQDIIKLSSLPKSLIKSPYKYIQKYYESIYPFMGGKCFKLLSLIPTGLVIPKIPRGKKLIKQKISFFLISNPGTGKTSIAEEFEKLTYNPIFIEYITKARLNYEISNQEHNRISLITSDVATILNDDDLVKLLEGILGEEGAISYNTMHNRSDDENRKKIDGVAYLSGTSENIQNKKVRDGFLRRTSPLIVVHTNKEHEEIIDIVNDGMGEVDESDEVNFIPTYYEHLRKIQDGEGEINPINGYIFSNRIKDQVKAFIKPLVKPTFVQFGVNAIDETEQFYRFLVNHSFLNLFEREIQDYKLVINDEDLEVAKSIIKNEVETKHQIYSSISFLDKNKIKTMEQLRKWEYRRKIKKAKDLNLNAKFIMKGMVHK